jgi:hypothetical protein
MKEVLDDLAFYAVSNDLTAVSDSIEQVKRVLLQGEAPQETASNVLPFNSMVRVAKR